MGGGNKANWDGQQDSHWAIGAVAPSLLFSHFSHAPLHSACVVEILFSLVRFYNVVMRSFIDVLTGMIVADVNVLVGVWRSSSLGQWDFVLRLPYALKHTIT